MVNLPKFQRTRGRLLDAAAIARLEENVAAYASALTDERRGLLAHGLTFDSNFQGAVVTMKGVKVPDDWVSVSFGPGWAQWADGNYPPCAMRKRLDGTVESRGLAQRTSGTGLRIALYPTGFAPASGRQRILPTTAASAPATAAIDVGGLDYFAGSTASWFCLDGLQWDAADRRPSVWPTASQHTATLPDSFTGEPAQVLVLDARDESTGLRAAGVRAQWVASLTGNRSSVIFQRFDGLSVGRAYTLTVAVLAA